MADVLILGATGMLGHALLAGLSPLMDTVGTARGAAGLYRDHPILGSYRLVGGVTAEDHDSIDRALRATNPDLVINCIGAIKQAAGGHDPTTAIKLNALLPHELAIACERHESRLIHISTDCVFSGLRGNYAETDIPDATDLYGRSKLLGELDRPGCLTLRTSLIGRELRERLGLVEWFLSNRGRTVKGYTRAIFSGVTSAEMARVMTLIIERAPDLEGIWHLAAQPIDKCDLLGKLNTAFETSAAIVPDDALVCDRSLNGAALQKRLSYTPPSWDELVDGLTRHSAIYDSLAGA